MKKVYIIVPGLLLLMHVLFRGCNNTSDAGMPVSFNEDWHFIRQDSANMDKILPGIIPNHKWEDITLPHTASPEPITVSGSQWTGICWYRKVYKPEKKLRNKHIALLFDGAMHDAIVYINGAEVYHNLGGYLPFYVDISNDLQYGKENEIMVKLDNREDKHIPPGKAPSELDCLYYSGLYRNVTLLVKDKLHITNAIESDTLLGGGVLTGFRHVSGDSAVIVISAQIHNDDITPRSFTLSNTLCDAAGKAVATGSTAEIEIEPWRSIRLEMELHVMNPALWSPEKPFLYSLSTELLSEKGIIDRTDTRLGIRSAEIRLNKGLFINGEPLKISGTSRHQEYPYIGYALSDNANYRDAYKIKEAGFNLVRCSYYPQSPAFLDACDELGLLVVNTVPGDKFLGDSVFCEATVSNTRDLCRRDRNHPSVIIWDLSLGGTTMPYSFLKRLHRSVKAELPYGNNYTACAMDTICDIYLPAGKQAAGYYKKYSKRKPLLIGDYAYSEYIPTASMSIYSNDDTVIANQHGFPRNAGEKAMLQQVLNFQAAHNDNLASPAIGDITQCMFDHNTGNSPAIESTGIMDIFRLPKFAYWFYRSQAGDDPVCFVASYNDTLSGNIVKVFSNAERMVLLRNDTMIFSCKEPDTDANSINLEHAPFTFVLPGYKPGTIKAIGLKKDQEYSSHRVTTAYKATAIRLSVDYCNKPLKADGSDAIFIYATLVDSLDNPVFTADSLISFSVKGDAVILGNNPVKAEAGIATALLRSGNNPGKVMVRASAENMAIAEIMIETRK